MFVLFLLHSLLCGENSNTSGVEKMLHLSAHGPRPLENYRIHVVPIYLPPLRERPADIPLLAQHFLQRFTHETVKAVDGFTPDGLQQMMMYEWPCNVRELADVLSEQSCLQRIVRSFRISCISASASWRVPGKWLLTVKEARRRCEKTYLFQV